MPLNEWDCWNLFRELGSINSIAGLGHFKHSMNFLRTSHWGKDLLPWVFRYYIIANVLQAIVVAKLQLHNNWTLTEISHEILRIGLPLDPPLLVT